jgi:hypothetical protein
VDAEDNERIVDAHPVAQLDSQEAVHTGDEANHDGCASRREAKPPA